MRVGALALLVLALPQPAAAQCPSRFGVPEFIALVDKYRAGDDAPVELLCDCPSAAERLREDIERIHRRLRAGRPAGASYQALREDPLLVQGGAMLLFDAGNQALRQRQPAVITHVATASSLLEIGGEASAAFAAEWHAVVARWLRVQSLYPQAEQLLASARRWMPDDATVLYESGVTAELLATAYERRERVHNEIVPRTPTDRSAPRGDPAKALEQAAGWFAAILTREARQDLVSVRLAHVLLMQGQAAWAARLADEAAGRTEDPAVAYVAHLLAGAALEGQGDFGGAARHYVLASARYTRGQSATIALSEVLQRQGRHEEARSVLDSFLRRPLEPRDPWWALMVDSEPHINGVLAGLRKRVRR